MEIWTREQEKTPEVRKKAFAKHDQLKASSRKYELFLLLIPSDVLTCTHAPSLSLRLPQANAEARIRIQQALQEAKQEFLEAAKDGRLTELSARLDAEKAAKKSQEITAGLRRIRSTMHESIEKNIETLKVLDSSSGVLKKTKSEYDEQSKVVKAGSNILTRIGRRENTDKVLIGLAFLFFCAVVAYIIKNRMVLQIPSLPFVPFS